MRYTIFSLAILTAAFGLAADYDLAGTNATLTTLSGYDNVTNSGTTDATLTLNLSGTETFSGTFKKGGANSLLDKTGNGRLILNSASQWTTQGKITVSQGTLEMAIPQVQNGYTHSSLDVASGATLQLNGQNALGNGVSPAITLTVNGNLVLASNSDTLNSYQKLTGISLVLNNGTVSEIATTTTTYHATLFPETTTIKSTGTSTISAPFSVRNDYTTTFNVTDGTLTVSGQFGEKFFANYDAGNLKKSGTGTLVLSNANNQYTGTTTVSAGTLKCGASSVLETSSKLDLTGTLDLAGTTQTVKDLTGTGSVTNSASTAAAMTVNMANDGNFSGKITGKIALTKTGSGTWNVTLSGGNYWSGLSAVRVENGKMIFDKKNDIGTRPLSAPITVTGANSMLDLAGYNALGYDGASMTLNVENGATVHLSGNDGVGRHGQQFRGITTNLNNGHITAAGNDYYMYTSKGIRINSQGTSTIAASFNMRDTGVVYDVTSGTLTTSGNYIQSSGNASGITKNGAGTLVLQGTESTTNAPLTVNAGGLVLDGGNWNQNITTALGTDFQAYDGAKAAGSLTLNGSYTFDLADAALHGGSNFSLNSLTLGDTSSLNILYDGQTLDEVDDIASILWDMGSVNLLTVAQNKDATYAALADMIGQDPVLSHYLQTSTATGSFTLGVNTANLPEPGTWSLFLLLLAGLWKGRKRATR